MPDFDTMSCAGSASAPAAGSSLPALSALATKESRPIRGRIVAHGHGTMGAEPPVTATRDLARELRAAADRACRLPTIVDAQRAGYVASSAFTEGVGQHWTNWSLVDAPFDPARPAMLLYDTNGRLVGFSFWTRASSSAPPEGFSSAADHWHRHFGMCFVDGLLAQENLTSSNGCQGVWLNGSDLWMLHAWVVPERSNPFGVFAPLNPTLCHRNVADVVRCPGM